MKRVFVHSAMCKARYFRLINFILMHKLMQHTPPHNVISFQIEQIYIWTSETVFRYIFFFYAININFAVTVFGLKLVLLYMHFTGELSKLSLLFFFHSFRLIVIIFGCNIYDLIRWKCKKKIEKILMKVI